MAKMRRLILVVSSVLVVGALICAMIAPYSEYHPFRVQIPGLGSRHLVAFEDGDIVLISDGGWMGRWCRLRSLAGLSIALAFSLLLLLLPGHIRSTRASRRASRRHCPSCNYNLTGNTSGVCPECGTELAAPKITSGQPT